MLAVNLQRKILDWNMNCVATTARAFVTVKASNPNFRTFLLPLHSRRSLCRVSATNNEEAAAKVAAANADRGAPTIFDKIIAKEIPSTIVYEDDKVLAFRDINPQAPVHVVIIPKNRDGLTELGKAESRHVEILGQLLYAAKKVAEKEGILHGQSKYKRQSKYDGYVAWFL
ncbi:14 kDa zinc-binding protein-like isoform X1 [Rosa rugosa]|uniref:14 kDa zinc-binding protein-like isoform X1 n=2 Tax=Rosa rugosa TaxID=74645 RepID=UPI002B403D16|nr:14 kDa zinc-binding protein-like isoform X1 [Rosa rugosa]XP_062022417.1 14 kDa zinc-binding protein-like isoform X1 [Rosa rugosa]XP_062022418.1 14 kDa zinc-binding protein-like isoform X1 [Rosa rugosa]XP_062022420.1 14 kDa zinc-binding protein-like isoform X1 [Rosa rugosa]XP_062022421.1 14 kDa zinc-binding protein-like isoform X1 [Rosa rugosa]XP_062022422.1 14 kDa zinc-binding protein-like isoform X1 [Rosa rugosa]XP_062022423.1 14 kDa zinc-binding protein-like isoform X1 [Rosa rugosa]XP_0